MISLFSFLLTFLGVLFWAFRAIATLLFQLDRSFFATPLNVTMEIIVLFATLPCIILVFKRNIVGAAAYFGIYLSYFGQALYNRFIEATDIGFNITNSADLLCTTIGVIIPFLIFLDILFNKNRNIGKGNSKSDWFYKNKDYDREYDKRADRNQYRL